MRAPEPPRVHPEVSQTPGSSRHLALWTSGLPPDLLQDAGRRLGVGGLVFAAGHAVGIAVGVAFNRLGLHRTEHSINALNVLAIGIGLAVFAIPRWRALSTGAVVTIGLLFEVLGGFLIVLPEAILLPSRREMQVGVSWLTVWISLFPLLLPTRPAVTVAAGLITATMSPLAQWIVTALGSPWPSTSALAHAFVPNYTIALLASLPAVILHKLRRAVSEARAMGSYRLEERLGGGGMGEVWRASHRLLARPAAIKLIRRDALAASSEEEVRRIHVRFEREAQATASLSSPHTVQLYDFGVGEDGTFYYVMELLLGLDLERLVLRHGPMPPERAVHFLLQACESLEEAHALGLIHRDVKPANLYACRAGTRLDYLKVLDFGLVTAHAAEAGGETRMTMGDVVIGTPAYMPPEMARGEPLDARTDLYAVGCVGYWLVAGVPVFEGRTAMEVISRHLEAPPVPPSRRSGLPVPEALEVALLACLAKDRRARPSSARELAERLAGVPLARPWTTERAAAWWSENLPAVPAAPPTWGSPPSGSPAPPA